MGIMKDITGRTGPRKLDDNGRLTPMIPVPPPPMPPAPTDAVAQTEFEKPLNQFAVRKDIKRKKFAQGIVSGLNLTKAALAAGSPVSSARRDGSVLMKDPVVRKEIARLSDLMEKRNLGLDRALTELDKGLTNGKLGSHAEYLDKQLKMLGAIKSGPAEPSQVPSTIFNALIIEAERRGQRIEDH